MTISLVLKQHQRGRKRGRSGDLAHMGCVGSGRQGVVYIRAGEDTTSQLKKNLMNVVLKKNKNAKPWP